jgi:hypothetical protein
MRRHLGPRPAPVRADRALARGRDAARDPTVSRAHRSRRRWRRGRQRRRRSNQRRIPDANRAARSPTPPCDGRARGVASMTVPTPGPVTKLLDAASSQSIALRDQDDHDLRWRDPSQRRGRRRRPHRTEHLHVRLPRGLHFSHDNSAVTAWPTTAPKASADLGEAAGEFGHQPPDGQPHSEESVLLVVGSALASGWSTCCLSWWRDFTPSLRNALRR